jgi:hypothetical protein
MGQRPSVSMARMHRCGNPLDVGCHLTNTIRGGRKDTKGKRGRRVLGGVREDKQKAPLAFARTGPVQQDITTGHESPCSPALSRKASNDVRGDISPPKSKRDGKGEAHRREDDLYGRRHDRGVNPDLLHRHNG